MNLRPLLLAAIVVIPVFTALAQEDEETDPTDARMVEAMEKDPSTAGMVEAISTAEQEWDDRMNAAYKRLKQMMEPEEWAALVAAQKAWITFRDAQQKSFEATFALMEGTMYIPVSLDQELTLTRDRARFLENYAEIISER